MLAKGVVMGIGVIPCVRQDLRGQIMFLLFMLCNASCPTIMPGITEVLHKKKAEYYIKKLNKSTYTIMSGNMHIRLYAYINNVYKLTLNAGKSYSIE